MDFGDTVGADGREEGGHCEGGEDDHACGDDEGEGEEFEDTGYWVVSAEGFVWRGGTDCGRMEVSPGLSCGLERWLGGVEGIEL